MNLTAGTVENWCLGFILETILSDKCSHFTLDLDKGKRSGKRVSQKGNFQGKEVASNDIICNDELNFQWFSVIKHACLMYSAFV